MSEEIKKLLKEVEEQEQYCKELEEETVQNRGVINEAMQIRYLKSRLNAAKQYALLLDRHLQGEQTYG